MKKITRFVGLDVHAETIAVAVADSDGGEVRSLGTIPNRPDSVAKLVRKLGTPGSLKACYEAGPCGYGLYWQLTGLGVACDVVAPTLIPVRAGDRVKTDRRDAERLARLLRSGELTPAWVPTPEHQALRSLVRLRETAKADQLRARNRLQKFLLFKGLRAPAGIKPWTQKHLSWVKGQRLPIAAEEVVRLELVLEVDHAAARIERLDKAIADAVQAAAPEIREVVAALQVLRGVRLVSAATLVAEIGPFSRFRGARQLMAYAGIVSGEHSSGASISRGGITKTGNAHVRRIAIEAAWAYRHKPNLSKELRARQAGQPPELCEVAMKAQHRLHGRYVRLLAKGKLKPNVVTAVGRELLGFLWNIGCRVERNQAAASSAVGAA